MTNFYDLTLLEMQLADVSATYSDYGRRAVRGGFYLSEIAALVMKVDSAQAVREDFDEYCQRQPADILLGALKVELRDKSNQPTLFQVETLKPFFEYRSGQLNFFGVNHAPTYKAAEQLVDKATDLRPFHDFMFEVVTDKIFAQDPLVWLGQKPRRIVSAQTSLRRKICSRILPRIVLQIGMAVYTDLSDEALRDFVALYDIGDLLSAKGIVEGLTNTNYLLVTTTGPYILTLHEGRVRAEDLPFFLGLMDHWSARGITCPKAVAGRDGERLRQLGGKPTALFTFLNGMPVKNPQRAHIAALGETIACAHLASEDFALQRDNALGIGAWGPFAAPFLSRADELAPGFSNAIAAEIAFLQGAWPQGLPKGAIHADLSADNIFFFGTMLSGIIDFNYACTDYYAYELALLLNDWCFEGDGQFNATKARTLFAAYTAKRRLRPEEIAAMPVLARGASLPYLLTRLHDWFKPEEGALVKKRSPLDKWAQLKFHQQVKSAAEYGLFE